LSELSAGEYIAIYVNNSTVPIGTTTVDLQTGEWSYEHKGLADQSAYQFSAAVIDVAGNLGNPSADFNIATDQDPPPPPPPPEPGDMLWQHGIGTGNEAVIDQTDDDWEWVGIVNTGFTSIDAGGGFDTLVFEGSGMTITLADGKVEGFEQFDLSNQLNTYGTRPDDDDATNMYEGRQTGNTLELTFNDVKNLVDDSPMELTDTLNRPGSGETSPVNFITILGDGDSTVKLDATGWSKEGQILVHVSNFKDEIDPIVDGVFDRWHYDAGVGSDSIYDVLIQVGVKVE
jgi:hypothetical protein